MNDAYEVLNPWAEADPIPLKGLAPRLSDLNGKRIGLFYNGKVAAVPTLNAVEQELKKRFPEATFARYGRLGDFEMAASEHRATFEKWIQEVDAVVLSMGD